MAVASDTNKNLTFLFLDFKVLRFSDAVLANNRMFGLKFFKKFLKVLILRYNLKKWFENIDPV